MKIFITDEKRKANLIATHMAKIRANYRQCSNCGEMGVYEST